MGNPRQRNSWPGGLDMDSSVVRGKGDTRDRSDVALSESSTPPGAFVSSGRLRRDSDPMAVTELPTVPAGDDEEDRREHRDQDPGGHHVPRRILEAQQVVDRGEDEDGDVAQHVDPSGRHPPRAVRGHEVEGTEEPGEHAGDEPGAEKP